MDYFAQFLEKRGFTQESFLKLFEYTKSHIRGMEDACKFLHDLPKDTKIGLLTDYDTDGLMSGIINYLGMHLIGFQNMSISRRYVERGYSFDERDIDDLGDVEVIITSDVGIACYDAINYAKDKGIYVIVTDHHVPVNGATDNNADIVIDYLLDSKFKNKNVDVCGAYTIWLLFDKYLEMYADEFENFDAVRHDVDLVRHFAAMATVADAMPLTGVNHEIVKEMLHFFNYINPLNGNDEIVNGVCNDGVLQNVYNNFHRFVKANQDAYYVSFDMRFLEYTIIPTMNSVKRMCDDTAVIYTMFFGSEEESAEAVQYLINLNTARKVLVNDLFERVYNNHINQPFESLIYMTDAPSGVLGLLATKIMSQTELPTVVFNQKPVLDKTQGCFVYEGSIRSPRWYPFLSRVNSSGYGVCAGHEFAAGLKVRSSDLYAFYAFLVDEIERYGMITQQPVSREQIIDMFEVVLDYDENFFDFMPDVDRFMTNLKRYAPFGVGLENPKILLKFHKDHGAIKLLKEGKHTKITVTQETPRDNGTEFQVLFWNTPLETVEKSMYEGAVYATGYLSESYYNGRRSIDFVAEPVFDGSEVM